MPKRRGRRRITLRLPPRSKRVDVTRGEFESLRTAVAQVFTMADANRRSIDRLDSRVADLAALIAELHRKIRL